MVTLVSTPGGRRLAADLQTIRTTTRTADEKAQKQSPSPRKVPAKPPRPAQSTTPVTKIPRQASSVSRSGESLPSNIGIVFGCVVLGLFAVSVISLAVVRGGLFKSLSNNDESAEQLVLVSKPVSTSTEATESRDDFASNKVAQPVVEPPITEPQVAPENKSIVSEPAPDPVVVAPAPTNPSPVPESANDGKLTTQEIVKQCEPSVCRVHTQFGSLGTGFVVAPQIVATNEHVVGLADPSGITISFPSRGEQTQYRRVELAYAVPEVDLVLLRVREMPGDILPLEVARIAELEKGEPLLVIGNPGGLTNVVTQGLFGSVQSLNGEKYLQLSMSINRGNSGGPALTASGRVAGVVTLKSPQEGIGLAIPGDVLTNAVSKIASAPRREIDRNVSWWRARQTGTKLVVGCNMSLDLIRLYATVAQRGGNPRQAVQRAARRNEQLTTQVRAFADDLKGPMESLANADLDDQDQQLLNQLSNAFQQLARVAIQPPNSPNDMRNVGQWAQRLPQLEQQLRSRLGMMNTADHVELESD
ncbi:MAG: trypsin-like peptidase domain-containing protein [Planctomycetota bacterium]|nr:trypsin-like peptidase domain-containing protein [Planctomycetota bacterium]